MKSLPQNEIGDYDLCLHDYWAGREQEASALPHCSLLKCQPLRQTVEWSWTFGDGGMSTARNPSHVFASPGTYTIRVVVRNSKSTDSISKTLTVRGESVRRRAVRR